MTEPTPLAAVLFVHAAGSANARKEIADAMQKAGGRVLNGEGGSLVAIFTNGDAAPSACLQAAIECQLVARSHGIAARAGASCGPLSMGDASGGANIEGACLAMAARLHDLAPESAGRILVDGATVDYLAFGLRSLCRTMGSREIGGAGTTEVYSLDWTQDALSAPARVEDATPPAGAEGRNLAVSVGRIRHVFKPGDSKKDAKVGRSATLCTLVLAADIVSGVHAELSHESGEWFLTDMSRHGTWLRQAESGEAVHVHGSRVQLAAKGSMCLGRPFAADPQGATTLEFEQLE